MLLFPLGEEVPSSADAEVPGVADVVGFVFALEVGEAFDIGIVVAHEAVSAVATQAEASEFDAEFKFAGQGRCHGAVEAVTYDFGVFRVVAFFKGKVGSVVEVDDVEAEADRGDQVDEGVLAEELPAEHPVGAVGEPFNIVEGRVDLLGRGVIGDVGTCAYACRIGICRAFGGLHRHKVDVEPGEELLVLGTDVHVQSEVVVIELVVARQRTGVGERRVDPGGVLHVVVRCFSLVAPVLESHGVHVALEFATHAAVVRANRNEPADVVLFVKTFFDIGEGAGGECEQA